ncbi:MAG TPA: hypothetical protein VN578_04710 [Candidatus Binatia bacterium]|jgi:hypothetical protein|nr:hypothetical protein [Candidatus Binatia bacterium]
MTKRKILVILSNRLNRNQKPRFLELDCDEEGNILKESTLRSRPRQPRYHEVWENDEGRTEFAACHRFKRKYGHKLQKAR